MNPVGAILVLMGALLGLLAGIGLLRFSTPFARFHSAGKASPVAFILVAAGVAIDVGPGGAAPLAVATTAMLLTFPVGIHLLFRAVHRTAPVDHLRVDDLEPAEHVPTSSDSPSHRDEDVP